MWRDCDRESGGNKERKCSLFVGDTPGIKNRMEMDGVDQPFGANLGVK